MMKYTEMTARQRQAEYDAVLTDYEKQKALGLKLNMARGKPGREQLDMVMEMYNIPLTADDFITDGIDARNYGYVAGIPIARKLFAEFEKDCEKHEIHQYYLIRATNENADRFYKKFENVQLDEEPMLRKILKDN